MSQGQNDNELKSVTIAETEEYLAWRIKEPDGEITYHLQLNNVTVHFFQEEWDEFMKLARLLAQETGKQNK